MKNFSKKTEEVYNVLKNYPNGLTAQEMKKMLDYEQADSRLIELTERYRGEDALVKVEGKRINPDSGVLNNVYYVIDPSKNFYEALRPDLKGLEKVLYCIKGLADNFIKIDLATRITYLNACNTMLVSKSKLDEYGGFNEIERMVILFEDKRQNTGIILDEIYTKVRELKNENR